MSALTIDVDISKVQEFIQKLAGQRVGTFHRALVLWGRPRLDVLAHQEEQVGIDGPYRGLSETYAAWKEEHYPGQPILQATDEMIGSIKESATAESYTIGFTDPKAPYHMGDGQFNNPNYRRDPLFIDSDMQDRIQQKALDFFGGVEDMSG